MNVDERSLFMYACLLIIHEIKNFTIYHIHQAVDFLFCNNPNIMVYVGP